MEVKVSVIMPVYNSERYIRKALDSVLTQSLKALELICVDDGSTDGSYGILKEYAAAEPRLKLISCVNSGPGCARNIGLAQAQGDYVLFLDSDDWFEQDMLEQMLRLAEDSSADITLCKAQRFDDLTGEPLPSDWMLREDCIPEKPFSPSEISEYVFQFTFGQVWDKMFSRSFLQRTGIRFPALRNSEDMVFAYQTILSAGRIAVLKKCMVHYRVNRRDSVSNTVRSNPEAPYEAFRLVKEFWESREDCELYRKSFLNWAMEYLIWSLNNINDPQARRALYTQLHERWLPELGFEERPKSDYDRRIYRKYAVARCLPFPVYNSLLSLYKKLKSGKA